MPNPVRLRPAFAVALAALLVLLAGPQYSVAQPVTTAPTVAGANTLTGSVAVSNPLLIEALSEPYIFLADLANFVRRDVNGDPHQDSQVLARLDGDLTQASYAMPLPILPRGTISDIDLGAPGAGVQVYSVELGGNSVGDPFYGPFESETGWGTAYSSMRVENGTYEVEGGRVVAWSPDDRQLFPSDVGPDGRLFTADDPLAPLPAGWTVVDLDRRPFALLRDPTVDVPILEGDGGLKDLSDLGYTAAFDALLAELRLRYPFTAAKNVDFDAIAAEVRPLVEQAERDQDALAFNVAIARFAVLFNDGHVGVQPPVDDLLRRYGGGVGLTLGQTDDGAVIVRAVAPDSPAAQAGIQPGADILEWAGQPVATALAAQELIFPASSPHTTVLQRLALLPRREPGATLSVAFQNPGAAPSVADLQATADESGLFDAFDPPPENPAAPPVTVEFLDGRVGYVRVSSFFGDLAFLAAAWEDALATLDELNAPALIVDVRGNGGGAGGLATYFAGAFTGEPFALADAYFADETGTLVYAGTTTVDPTPLRWDKPVAVLIDQGCASACEIFAAAVARDPAALLVGQYPTAGVEGAVYPWNLPGDLYFQAPLGLYQVNGEIFIEGTGVPPTLDVPVTTENLISGDDVVLAAAQDALRPLARAERASRSEPSRAATLVASPATIPAP